MSNCSTSSKTDSKELNRKLFHNIIPLFVKTSEHVFLCISSKQTFQSIFHQKKEGKRLGITLRKKQMKTDFAFLQENKNFYLSFSFHKEVNLICGISTLKVHLAFCHRRRRYRLTVPNLGNVYSRGTQDLDQF